MGWFITREIPPNTRKPSLIYSNETSEPVPTRAMLAGSRFRYGLAFLSIRTTNEIYPYTGDSCDEYDAEASADC
jgi:hypothetical protein